MWRSAGGKRKNVGHKFGFEKDYDTTNLNLLDYIMVKRGL